MPLDNPVKLPVWTQVFDTPATTTDSTRNTWTDISGVSGSLVTKGGDLYLFLAGGFYRQINSGVLYIRLMLDGVTDYYAPASAGIKLVDPSLGWHHNYFAWVGKLTGVAPGTYTVKAQMHDNNSAQVTSDGNDRWSLLVMEE